MKNEERVTATRAKLIDAAINSLAQIGFHRTTFVEVSRRSELSRGAIHHHFDSIPDLMRAVVRDLGERIRADIVSGIKNVSDDLDIYDASVDFVWEQMRNPNYIALEQIRGAITTDPHLRESVSSEVVAVAEWLQQQARTIICARAGTENIDHGVVRVMLTALAGAATYDAALGTPIEDPERLEYRAALKRMIKLAVGQRHASTSTLA